VEQTNCNYCGETRKTGFFSSSDFSYVKCPKCGLVYQDPRPTFSELKKKVYTDRYFKYELRNQENFFSLMKLNLRDFNFIKLTSAMKPGQRRFLDIGCATGLLLDHMRSREWRTEGVELCRESADYAKKKLKLRVHHSSLEQKKFPTGLFDVVHMSHIIEHVPDPVQTLKEVYRILKPGGILFIITPNVQSLQAFLFRETWRSAHKDHLHLFSIKTLRRYLESADFRIISQFSYGGLAAGIRTRFLKRPLDSLAKRLNLGDVMAFACRK
jgi:2-polyprenyl-3-methyl-5-hydroxy-6-metoxy-1,4-benzoquinol methylase